MFPHGDVNYWASDASGTFMHRTLVSILAFNLVQIPAVITNHEYTRNMLYIWRNKDTNLSSLARIHSQISRSLSQWSTNELPRLNEF